MRWREERQVAQLGAVPTVSVFFLTEGSCKNRFDEVLEVVCSSWEGSCELDGNRSVEDMSARTRRVARAIRRPSEVVDGVFGVADKVRKLVSDSRGNRGELVASPVVVLRVGQDITEKFSEMAHDVMPCGCTATGEAVRAWSVFEECFNTVMEGVLCSSESDGLAVVVDAVFCKMFAPCTDWSVAGEFLETFRIAVLRALKDFERADVDDFFKQQEARCIREPGRELIAA